MYTNLRDFKKLKVWQKSIDFIPKIYKVTANFTTINIILLLFLYQQKYVYLNELYSN